MKKYLFGIFAIVLAIGFSAFTTSDVKVNNVEDPFYWYPVDFDTQLTTQSSPISGTADEKADVIGYNGCDNTAFQPVCLLGVTTSSLTIGTDVSGYDEEQKIRRD